MTRRFLAVAGLALALLPSAAFAQDARALYTETDLGGGLWRYQYRFLNDLNPVAFAGFNLYDMVFTLNGTTLITPETAAPNWVDITTTDFIEYFSLFPGSPPGGSDIGPGGSLSGFAFVANQQLGDLDFVATFTDPDNPTNPRFFSGVSSQDISTSAPEPGSVGLLAMGLASGILLRKRNRRLHR